LRGHGRPRTPPPGAGTGTKTPDPLLTAGTEAGGPVQDSSDENGSALVAEPRTVADFGRASAPRVYDYLLGGKDNFPPDRALAEELMDPVRGYPGLRELVRENRGFVLKAAAWCASMLSIAQFLDLGCGLPAVPSVHATVRDIAGLAAVCYVDHDPVVLAHVRAALHDAGPGLSAVQADVSDPAALLADEAFLEVTGLDRPVCVILGGTLSGMDAETAGNAVKGFAEAMAPGSCVVISCVSYCDQALAGRMAGLFGATGTWRNHSLADVQGFFDAGGLRLVRGQAADVRRWPLLEAACERPACIVGGIGIRD